MNIKKTSQYLIVALIAFLGIASSLYLYHLTDKRRQAQTQDNFESLVQNQAETFQTHLTQCLDVLFSLRDFYAASVSIEPDEFETFTKRTIEQHPEILSINWMAYVPGKKTNFFEHRVSEYALANKTKDDDIFDMNCDF